MGIFEKLFSKKKKTVEEIMMIEDEDRFVIEMSGYLSGKCNSGYRLDALSREERSFYLANWMEVEVYNEGFYSTFYEYQGEDLREFVDAFIEIGAVEAAKVCKDAIDLLGRDVPQDADERKELLTGFSETQVETELKMCDAAFFSVTDDLNTLKYEYAMRNRVSFF